MFTFVISSHVPLNSIVISPQTGSNGSQASPPLIDPPRQFSSHSQCLGSWKAAWKAARRSGRGTRRSPGPGSVTTGGIVRNPSRMLCKIKTESKHVFRHLKFLSVVLSQGHFTLQEYLAMSADNFGCHNSGGAPGNLMGRGQGCC